MSHIKISSDLVHHQKTMNAGNAAMGAWLRALCFCARNETGGLLSKRAARLIGPRSLLMRLVAVGLMEIAEEGGYRLVEDDTLWRIDRSEWSRSAYPDVRARDGARCRYCGRDDRPTAIDHVIPRCRGGGDGAENLVVACVPCNASKGGRTPAQAGLTLRPPPERN